MIRFCKKLSSIVLILVILLSCAPCTALAFGTIDQQKEVSLTIYYDFEGAPVADVDFALHYVADMLESGEFCLAEDFQKYPVQLKDLDAADWRALAKTLTYYVQADDIVPIDQGKTNVEGILTFPTGGEPLYPGLYLVIAQPKVGATHTHYTEPFLICLPSEDQTANDWQYDVSVRAKHTDEENDNNIPGGTIERKVLKIWENDAEAIRPNEIIVHLIKNGEIYDTVTLNENNGWRHNWTDLPEYDEQGILIQWGIIEETVLDYRVFVSQEGITFTITNTYAPEAEPVDTVCRTAQKIWNDKGYEYKRPNEITVHLMCNGELFDTQVLNADCGWEYTWENLPAQDGSGNEFDWSVEEEAVPDYVVAIEQKGDYFLLTNSIMKPTLPQTGVLWWPVPVLIAAGLLFLIIGYALKGRREDA